MPYATVLAGLLAVTGAFYGLRAHEAIRAQFDFLSSLPTDSQQEGVSTTWPAAYIRWAGHWWALVVAWVCLGLITVEILLRTRREGRADPRPEKRLGVLTALATLLGFLFEQFDLAPGIPDIATPPAAQVRNALGWCCGGLIVYAQSLVLHRVLGGDSADGTVALAQRVVTGLRDMRTMLFASGVTLAIGVLQISSLVRLQIVTAIRERSDEMIGGLVALHPAAGDLEESLSLAAGILFASLVVLAFFPGLVLLEFKRIEVLRLRRNGGDDGIDPAPGSPPAEAMGVDPALLERSAWQFSAEAAGVLLPVLTGLLATRL